MKRAGPVIVTGARGFIGRHLVTRLEKQGHEVIGWIRETGDLRDSAAVGAVLREVRPATIFHLAALAPAEAGTDWTIAAAEVAMLTNLVHAAGTGARLVHAGSMAEYGYSGELDEAYPLRPRSVYGFAKASATNCAMALAATQGADIRVARLFGVYGPGEASRRLVPHIAATLAAGRAVELSDGEQVRDFVHVEDVCDRLIALAEVEQTPFPVVNIGTGVGVTLRHVGEWIARHLGADSALLKFGAVPPRPTDEKKLVARTARLSALGPLPVQHWLEPGSALLSHYVSGLIDADTNQS